MKASSLESGLSMPFPHLEKGLGGKSVWYKARIACRGLVFMKRVAVAQGTLPRSIRHQRWEASSPVMLRRNFSRDLEENADYERLTRTEVLQMWQDANDLCTSSEIQSSPDTAWTSDRDSALVTLPRSPWRRFISKFRNDKKPFKTHRESGLVQMSFRERLRTWLHIQDSARWPQGW
ncbi:hypothetical protein Mapa_000378 [Marchantia paleacea]|nr:hypothetical protein Mapa_000378 [Marchantia paleacea]